MRNINNFLYLVVTVLFLLISAQSLFPQLQRISLEGGYIRNSWEDATNSEKLNVKKSSGIVLLLNAPVVEVIKNRLYFHTAIRFAQRGATVTGPYYKDMQPVYKHEISYTSLDIPIFYEFRYPILKYTYRYTEIFDKLAITARLGIDFSFLLSSNTSINDKNGNIIYSGKAIEHYSPRINDIPHHICMGIGAEYYFSDNYGISLNFGYDCSKALTKTLNHPVFQKTIEYEPANTKFYEQAIMFSIGGIYRFTR